MERIQSKTVTEIILPSKELIHFKEALIFAFLGYLRLNNNINVLNSVTGASRNCVAGALYLG
jgi:anhydro-N-acetylmuramic acid kinase